MEVLGARKNGAREGDTRAPFFLRVTKLRLDFHRLPGPVFDRMSAGSFSRTAAGNRAYAKLNKLRSRGDKSNSWKSSMSPLPQPFSDSIFQNKLQCFSGFGQSRITPAFCYTLSFDQERRNTPGNSLITRDSYSSNPRWDGIDCVPPKTGFCLTIFISNLWPPVLYL